YDPLGHLVRTEDALHQVTTQVWEAGLLERVIDPLGVSSRFGYDDQRRLTTTVEAWGDPTYQRTTVLGYDAAGNVQTVSRPLAYDFDAQDVAVPAPAHTVTRYRYDGMNRRTQVIESDDDPSLRRTTTTVYDG